MKRAYLFIFGFLGPALTLIHAVASSEEPGLIFSLEELGYCVIPNVISRAETEQFYQRVWHEYIEKAWPNCKMDDRRNWEESFP
ncbi:MAG TPA: hypothetical protein VN457_01330, partial [Chlamydiales bacterium]|nr:hypothetical protein [Chlamydiales bacterium]